MTYKEAIKYMYDQAPMFQQRGSVAYKMGLETTRELDRRYGERHKEYATIHVGGTNGKGSTSHTLAAILQSAGYKVGLYTSPHLKDFRERIRVNGELMKEDVLCKYVEEAKKDVEELHPSFFELTTIMAFRYFAEENVDVAVVEVGLGGLTDCTNIIDPEISVITNVSIDHTDLLGKTVLDIAKQKAGIIKKNVPVIVGERQAGVADVMSVTAKKVGAPLVFADTRYHNVVLPAYELRGDYQDKNMRTVMTAVDVLKHLGWKIEDGAVRNGLMNVVSLTGLMGRWQILGENPRVICDTGHNEAGVNFVVNQLAREKYDVLRVVLGMVGDKDIDKMLSLLPKNAVYYFTNAQIPRALNREELKAKAAKYGLEGESCVTVQQAFEKAKADAGEGDLIFVGGSNFTVAEII